MELVLAFCVTFNSFTYLSDAILGERIFTFRTWASRKVFPLFELMVIVPARVGIVAGRVVNFTLSEKGPSLYSSPVGTE